MEKIKERSSYWDNIKGFLIILVVFAHFLYQCMTDETVSYIVRAIYTFHMPAFVFVSGYFGKSERSRSFEGISRLLFLYVIFNGAMSIFYGVEPITEPKYSYWYLLALVFWRLTAHYTADIEEINLILMAISVFAGFYTSIDNSFAVSRIISFYPYYMAGYLLSEEKSNTVINSSLRKRRTAGLLCVVLSGAGIYLGLKIFDFSADTLMMYPYTNGAFGAFGRCLLFAVGFSAIYALRNLTSDKKLPLITTFGQNSLWIYLFHRPVTLAAQRFLEPMPTIWKITASAAAAVVLCLILGSKRLAALMNGFAGAVTELFDKKARSHRKTAAQVSVLLVCCGYIFVLVTNFYSIYFDYLEEEDTVSVSAEADIMYAPVSSEKAEQFKNAFRLTFAGDLILLEDQVKRGYKVNGYDFSDVFEYASPYISSADLAIGVFEGPVAGKEEGYSTSNYGDGKEVRLNFPDEFAQNVKDAGFDLVTTANNHLLDKGEEGALRTLDVLDSIGLDHTGSYRSAEEKQSSRIKMITADGIKFAVLSYTYGSNYYETADLANGSMKYISSFIKDTEGELFEQLKAEVEKDFEAAKAQDPDLIIVLPHIGTQFLNTSDEEQETWFDIFKKCGADIILGDHPHAVEPAMIEEYNGRYVYTLFCPGNFANIYRENQGDTSALADVYIDKNTKKIIGGGIIPLYTQSPIDGNYRALPVYEIENDPTLRSQLSTDDYERAKCANLTVTEIMLGSGIDITSSDKIYLFDETGYLRQKTTGLELTENMKNGEVFKAMQDAQRICFIGDSVTEGTKNGGVPWYEPIEEHLTGKSITNFSKGGCTVGYLIDNIDAIPEADFYAAAIGTNDIRYRDPETCAMTAEDFIKSADRLTELLHGKNSSAKILFIAPWYSTDGDTVASISYTQVRELNREYSEALEKYCADNSLMYVNANVHISEELEKMPDRFYLLDHIHPNASRGVIMYSEAVLV